MLVDGFTLTNPVQTGIKREATLLIGGALSVNEDSIGWRTHAKIDLDRILVSLAVPSQGASVKFFLKKNGEKLTALPIEIHAGTDFLEVPISELSSTSAEAGDYFNIEVLQVGSTVSGSNLRVQINQHTSSALADAYNLDTEYYGELTVTNQIARFLTAISALDVECVGHYEDWYDQPEQVNLGSISGVVRDGFNVKGFYAYHNFTDNEYRLVLRIEGGYVAKDFFRSVYVEGLGHFLTSEAEHSNVQANNFTQWRWTITDDMFNVIKNKTTTKIRISRTTELDYTEPYVIPSRYTVVQRDRLGLRVNNFSGNPSTEFTYSENKIGLMLNKNVLPLTFTVMEFYSDQNYTLENSPTVSFFVHVPGNTTSSGGFGCIKFPGFGNFSQASSTSSYNATYNTTGYYWNLKKEQPFASPKTVFDFGKRHITVDTNRPAYNRSYTAGSFSHATGVFKGWRSGAAGSSGGALGSISSTDVSGKTLLEIFFTSDSAHVWKYYLHIRFAHSNINRSSFNFIEFDLIGRFYASDANYWQQPTFTQFAWPISVEKFNAAPSASPHKMFYIA